MESEEIKNYYANDIEKNRLELEAFKLEGIRTREIIGRYLPEESLQILVTKKQLRVGGIVC